MGDFTDLTVYQKAYKLAMDIFVISKEFPSEEKFGLTNQIRRSSRSVCSNLAEGYRKRKSTAHFVAKLSDSEMENTETQVWLNFAHDCKYLPTDKYQDFISRDTEGKNVVEHEPKSGKIYKVRVFGLQTLNF